MLSSSSLLSLLDSNAFPTYGLFEIRWIKLPRKWIAVCNAYCRCIYLHLEIFWRASTLNSDKRQFKYPQCQSLELENIRKHNNFVLVWKQKNWRNKVTIQKHWYCHDLTIIVSHFAWSSLEELGQFTSSSPTDNLQKRKFDEFVET